MITEEIKALQAEYNRTMSNWAENFRCQYRIVDQFGRSIPMPDKHGFKIGDTISVKKPMRWSHEL